MNDKKSMITKIRAYQEKYDTSFGVDFWIGSGNRIFLRKDKAERDLTEDELKDLISKYEQIDSLIQKLTDETHILF